MIRLVVFATRLCLPGNSVRIVEWPARPGELSDLLSPSLEVRTRIKTSSDYILSLGLDRLLLRICSPPVSGGFGYSFCAYGSRLPSGTLEVVHSLLRPGTRAKFALLALQHSS